MKFLIVDDSKAMQNIITKAMKSIGYNLDDYEYAMNGQEALDKLQGFTPDLVLVDLHMPDMTGIELIESFKSHYSSIKAGIVSIDHEKKNIDAARAAGAVFYLHKPFTSEQLAATLYEQLGGNRQLEVTHGRSVGTFVYPSTKVIEKVLSSLGRCEVSTEALDLDDFNYSVTPLIIGALSNQAGQIKAHALFDRCAANTLAVFINHISATEALHHTNNHQIHDEAVSAVEVFMGILSVLMCSSDPDESFTVHAVIVLEQPGEELIEFVSRGRSRSTCVSLVTGELGGGQLLLC
ncbi:MAG: response regulator [Spongiibacteraceae bacterium]